MEKLFEENNFVYREEFEKLYKINEFQKKEISQMLTKSELVSRLDSIISQVNTKIEFRPTKEVVNKSLTKLNQKLVDKIEKYHD